MTELAVGKGYTRVQVLQVKSVRAYAHVVMSAVSASALLSMTHSSSICLKFMVIVFFSLLQKDDAGNWWWGGVMDFVDNFLETSFKNTGLKRLIKPLSLTIFLPILTSRTALFTYLLVMGEINLRIRLEKSSVIARWHWGYFPHLMVECFGQALSQEKPIALENKEAVPAFPPNSVRVFSEQKSKTRHWQRLLCVPDSHASWIQRHLYGSSYIWKQVCPQSCSSFPLDGDFFFFSVIMGSQDIARASDPE